jgi:hypothetical protein
LFRIRKVVMSADASDALLRKQTLQDSLAQAF